MESIKTRTRDNENHRNDEISAREVSKKTISHEDKLKLFVNRGMKKYDAALKALAK